MSSYDQFLTTNLIKYKNPDITKRDVSSVFTNFGDLRPKMENFVFNDGYTRNLLQLDGTIPVNFEGSVYNIPICTWLMNNHPYKAPLVFVKPTANMKVKVGRNVDQDGKIDLPYLREWKYPNSDLLGLIQILTIVFGEEPPVYSRSAPPQQQPQGNLAPGQPPNPTDNLPTIEEVTGNMRRTTLFIHEFISRTTNVPNAAVAGGVTTTSIILPEKVTMAQWISANMRIMAALMESGELASSSDIADYMKYTEEIGEYFQIYTTPSVMLYDYNYRKEQSEGQYRWGTPNIHSRNIYLELPAAQNKSQVPLLKLKTPCRHYQQKSGCNRKFCKFSHVCVVQGCRGDHPEYLHSVSCSSDAL